MDLAAGAAEAVLVLCVGAGPGGAAGSTLGWEVRLPLYDPATLITLGVFEVPAPTVASLMGKAVEPVMVGRTRARLSTLHCTSTAWQPLRVRALAAQGQEGGEVRAPAPTASSPAQAPDPGSVGLHSYMLE
ncbi:hypothetical protein HaLaN_00234 [Haematococcus lacustris]|uniref:Uncharacterized protein n=1 Tax=Haematococcus lacustris TaxID=44745 RepID=A0A699Y6G2_HAELA|nr:hypothetical protein HaLaN_00234 [Haematococcus lacustris]